METEFRLESGELISAFPVYQGKVYIDVQGLGQETYPFSRVLRELEQSRVGSPGRLGWDEAQVPPIHDVLGGVEILKAVTNAIGIDKGLRSQEVGLGAGKRINIFCQSCHRFTTGGDQK